MSKVESNDELRIREMQEAQRRAEARNLELDRAKKADRSFDEALRARRSAECASEDQARDARRNARERAGQRASVERREDGYLHPHERARRAALARVLDGRRALERRAHESLDEHRALIDRRDQHEVGSALDLERVDERLHEQDASDAGQVEERLEEAQKDAADGDIARDLERDRRRRRDHDRGEDDRRRPAPDAVGRPRRAHRAGARGALPPALLERIVGVITQVVEDGRTQLHLRLQSPGLEGVELEVKAQDGEVSCLFRGCSDRLRRALEGAQPTLTAALAKKGLKLKRLEAR